MGRTGLIIRAIYVLCLLGATVNHVRGVMAFGWLPPSLPWPTAAFWSSLTFLDPLAAILLIVRPKAGICATLAIIVTDVAHNLWFAATHSQGSLVRVVASNPFLLSQILFLLFVLATAPTAWRESQSAADSKIS